MDSFKIVLKDNFDVEMITEKRVFFINRGVSREERDHYNIDIRGVIAIDTISAYNPYILYELLRKQLPIESKSDFETACKKMHDLIDKSITETSDCKKLKDYSEEELILLGSISKYMSRADLEKVAHLLIKPKEGLYSRVYESTPYRFEFGNKRGSVLSSPLSLLNIKNIMNEHGYVFNGKLDGGILEIFSRTSPLPSIDIFNPISADSNRG